MSHTLSNTSHCPTPVMLPKPKTMAELIARVQVDKATLGRRADMMAWAIRVVCRVARMSPDTMQASPKLVCQKLEGVTAAMAGMGDGAWTNVTSNVRAAFRHVGIMPPCRRAIPYMPGWTALIGGLDMESGQLGLARFARFCSDRGVVPDAVDDAVYGAFLLELTENSVVRNAHKLHRRTGQIWNKLVQARRGFPTTLLTLPSYDRTYFVGWERFPASLKAEVDAHLDYLAGKDLLSVLEVRPLKPRSVAARRHQLGAYLSALVLCGEDATILGSLADALTEPRVRKGLKFFIERGKAAGSSNKQAQDIARMLLSVARHWVKQGPDQLEKLQGFCKRLQQDQVGLSEKNRTRLRQFDDPHKLQLLLKLPEALAASTRSDGKPTERQALTVQTALAIELLLMIPMRRGNLTKLNIEQHLFRGPRGVVQLNIPGHEVKNGVPIEADLPKATVKLLELYLKYYRPLLATAPSPWLFPGLPGRPKSCERLALQISNCIKERIGVVMNVHLFRHLAAKIVLEASPGSYGTIKFLHGHKNVQTTMRHYCTLETKGAVAHYDNLVAGIATASGPVRKRAASR